MSNIQMERDFYAFQREFENGEFSLQTVSTLIVAIREYETALTSEQVAFLLEIPLSVLSRDVELKNPGEWQRENRRYFAGNMKDATKSDHIDSIRRKFLSSYFTLEDIYNLTKYVQSNFKELVGSVDYLLRNTEVTIGEDVVIRTGSDFYENGDVFARYIKRAFPLQQFNG